MYFSYKYCVFVFYFFVKQSIFELIEDVGIFRSYFRGFQDGDFELELRVYFEVIGEFFFINVGEEIYCFGFRFINIWFYIGKLNDSY